MTSGKKQRRNVQGGSSMDFQPTGGAASMNFNIGGN